MSSEEKVQSEDEWNNYFREELSKSAPDKLNSFDEAQKVIDYSKQVSGDHYSKMEFEPIEYILANKLGYCEGNVIKYVSRYKDKGGVSDLEKAIHYLEILITKIGAE